MKMRSPVIKVQDICYVLYEHPDLDKIEAFLVDFGLLRGAKSKDVLYMRGTSGSQYIYVAKQGPSSKFLGIALNATARSDLEALTVHPGAGAIESIEAPGGGERVCLSDPNGFHIEVVHGIQEVPELKLGEPLILNYATAKNRLGNPQPRFKGPSLVQRLGHVGLNVLDYSKTFQFYSSVLGMMASDHLYDGDPGNQVGGFLRCDRGSDWTDHHTLAVFQNSKRASIHHASFELQDFDAVMNGHEWLVAKGLTPYWGVGRHVLGSQVFDYWRDPFGNMIEHYADGDVFNASTETRMYQRGNDLRKSWGPPVPSNFMS